MASHLRIQLRNKHGLHARPISQVVQVVQGFGSRLTISHAGRKADARSILELMSLGAGPGSTLEFEAEGEDEEALLAAVRALVEEGFGEL